MSATCIDTVYNRSHWQGSVHWWPRMWCGWKCHNVYACESHSLKMNILNTFILHIAIIFWRTAGAANTEKLSEHTWQLLSCQMCVKNNKKICILKQIKWVQTPELNDILCVCWEVIICIRVWLSLRKEVENLVRKSQCVGGVPSYSVTVFSVNILKLHQVLEIGWTALV